MTDKSGAKVPVSRIARLSKIGSLAAKVAGNMAYQGARQLTQGQAPSFNQLLMQPKNIEHLADKLANLRGAAMKLGQLLSMDAGELLPPELSTLLDKLRSNAQPMAHKQLVNLLVDEWGQAWLDKFSHFELRPFASASIGQVHLAYDEQVKKLAVKVQYPGVKASISSDVDNVATLLKLSGLLPSHLNLAPLFAEAKQQLLVEASYRQEAEYIAAYAEHLTQHHFVLPQVNQSLSNDNLLVMSFVEGVAIDECGELTQLQRDKIASRLIGLFFQELFEFRLMQTDPNFANYVYQADTGKIGLLDFGATRVIPPQISQGYLALISAGAKQDQDAMFDAAKQIGFFKQDIDPDYLAAVLGLFALACEPLRHQGPYHFGQSQLAQRIKAAGSAINRDKSQWHTPPVDALFIHRKLAGLYLLAAKLDAQVDVRELFSPY
ncbi:ABC1 kinase family protein [Motilimonas eburnea]|uniref:ABC1 kinase family protein n=1 Tax=Motilimonas eburnea TaxID=1737488 RepID=UPI001E405D36|nr:AarF/ABC1/UbiB kinase family protein [Motilimonas eburnea]MCE2572223.1 AarF/ABC1/UbiB kinase family protein [Motilimonas eburnea]